MRGATAGGVCGGSGGVRNVAFTSLPAGTSANINIVAFVQCFAGNGPATATAIVRAATADSTFANNVAAMAANNNAIPPDLSLMTKARHHGSAYVYSLITGFQPQPAELLKEFPDAKTPEGLHFNPYFANLNLAMAPPLTADGQVTYGDGTKATVDQMAQDVAAFLTWTAEPKLENRRRAGLATIFFLRVLKIGRTA